MPAPEPGQTRFLPEAAERLRKLAAELPLAVGLEPCRQLVAYLDAMLELNEKVNLTAIREPEPALLMHALDSLAAGLCGGEATRIAELGSGNGFPGVALALLWPKAEVALIEKTGKKCKAIEKALAAAGLERVQVVHADAQQIPALMPELQQRFDLLAARALGPPATVARLAAPLAANDARLLLWLDEDARPNAALPGNFVRASWHHYELPAPAARWRRIADYRRRSAK
jgi:16S rRNA (guanine527-N7)-methyltransferase